MKPAVLDRFLAKVGWPGVMGACWPWLAYRDSDGYGIFAVANSRPARASRVVYELAIGPIPDGLVIDHLCRSRSCVNPLHLEAVPQVVNCLRGESLNARNARKTHCHKGHPFTPENTYLYRGGRCCRACNRDAVRRMKVRRREGVDS